MTRRKIDREKNAIATLHNTAVVEHHHPPLIVEHINDIIQRIQFINSMNSSVRPSSAMPTPFLAQTLKKGHKSAIKKANILFEEFSKQDSATKDISNPEIKTKLQNCLMFMKIEYFSNSSSDPESVFKTYSLEDFQNEVKEENLSVHEGNKHTSKGIDGYFCYRSFLMHIYHMIINRLVRTAHLSNISSSKKGKDSKTLPPGYVSQIITKSLENIDSTHKNGVKSIHIHKGMLHQELLRLLSLIKESKDIVFGTKNIFPKIHILTEYEETKEGEPADEYEEPFEEESKLSIKLDTSRTERPKKSVITRKFYVNFTDIEENSEVSKLQSINDSLCEWPTCVKNKYYGRKELKVSQSESKIGKSKGKSIKNSKNNKAVVSKKAPTVFKKLMSPYYLDKDFNNDAKASKNLEQSL